MKVTPYVKEEYIPMCMVSGRDALFIGYSGSNFVSHNGHAHMEGHQGTQTGWYKAAAKHPKDFIQPSVMAGIQVWLYGAAVIPNYYEQEFIPESATLITDLKFRSGIKLRITSFFTYDDSIWCEKLDIVEMPESLEAKIGFRICNPFLSERLQFLRTANTSYDQSSDSSIEVRYRTGDFTGRGRLIADRPFDSFVESNSEFSDQCYAEGDYVGLKTGDTISRTMILLDDTETHITYDALVKKAELGFNKLYEDHKRLWSEYFATSDITTSDPVLNYEFKISRYLAKACLGVDSGIETLGMLPYHWRGGASCAWDEEMVHRAQLICGNFKETEHFTRQYQRQAPEGYRILKEKGLPGIAFSGWNSILGKFCGHRPIDEWITTFKPMFAIYATHTIYNEWSYNKNFNAEEYRTIATDVLKFLLSSLVKQGEDGLYYLTDVKDGNETGVLVNVDTSTTISFALGFLYVGEIYGIEEYTKIGQSMIKTLEGNRRPDGVLAAARNSPYLSSPNQHFWEMQRFMDMDISAVRIQLEETRTPFGYTTNASTEETRHWPWHDTWAVRNFVVAKEPEEAAKHLKHSVAYRSSLGAFPEFIRLDGYAIGYYYTTPHGCYITALAEACAALNGDELLLGYGFTKDMGDFSCRNIHVRNGAAISLQVKDGAFASLSIYNPSDKDMELTLSVCPEFGNGSIPEKVTIKAKSSFVI